MLKINTRVQFMVMNPDYDSPILVGEITGRSSATGNYTVLADGVAWASSWARDEGQIDDLLFRHYELPRDRLAVIERRSARLQELRLNRDRPKPYSLIAASTRIEEKTPRKVQTANVMSALGGGLAPAPLHLLT